MKKLGWLALALFLAACTRSDTQQARQELRKSGDEVKKELKSDAKFVKEEALKARREAQEGVKKMKKDLDSKN